MKNQYVGDINDYKKYGLIRVLAGDGEHAFRVGVFWMLTKDDERNDGNILEYLNDPIRWQHYDLPLFTKLHSIIHTHRKRTVSLVQKLGILPNATFVDKLLSDDVKLRKNDFSSALDSFNGHEIIFFDPDNGLEIKSKPLGRKNSNKYLYFPEVMEAFDRGHSLVIYQHFPFITRDLYINDRIRQLREATNSSMVFSVSTSRVCFFIVSQPNHIQHFKKRLDVLRNRWGSQFVQRP